MTGNVELRISGGLAGTQTVELAVSDSGADPLRAVLDDHEIGFEILDKRLEDLPDAAVLAVGSFHLGPGGAGLGDALEVYRRRLMPVATAVTIGGTPYELTETEAVAAALVEMRASQEREDEAADDARAQWQREYEQEQAAEDSEESKD